MIRSNQVSFQTTSDIPSYPVEAPAEWCNIPYTNLVPVSEHSRTIYKNIRVPMDQLSTALAKIQRCLRTLNIEGQYRPNGYADLRTKDNQTFQLATLAQNRKSGGTHAIIEFRQTSRGGSMYQDLTHLEAVLNGSKTIETLESEYHYEPLNRTSAEAMVKHALNQNDQIIEQTLTGTTSCHEHPLDPSVTIYNTLLAPYCTYNALLTLSESVDPQRQNLNSVVTVAEKVLCQLDDPTAQLIRSTVRDQIVTFAHQLNTTKATSLNGENHTTPTHSRPHASHGTVHCSLESINKSLEAYAFLSRPLKRRTAELSDDITHDEFLTALTRIAGAPQGQQHLSALALNSLNTLMVYEGIAARLQALPTFALSISSAKSFVNSQPITRELEQAVDRLAQTAGRL